MIDVMGDEVDVIIQQAEAEYSQGTQSMMGNQISLEAPPSQELLQLQDLFQQGFISEEEVDVKLFTFCDSSVCYKINPII